VCIVSHLHLYESTSSTRVYLANRSYTSVAAGNAGCAIQWHAFTKVAATPSLSRWPPCESKHAVAVLASINDAARQPRLRPVRGCERYDKSRSPKIDPPLTFSILPSHSPVTTPTTSFSVTIRSRHVQAISASGPGITRCKVDPIPHGYNNEAVIDCSRRSCETRDAIQVIDRVSPA
jgi:hypothetical protein